MRLSNLFIYGSVIIIVASSLGFLIFKALPISTGGSPNLANKVKALEKENQDLLDESAKTVKALSEKITQLNNDLNRSTRLLTEKDEEIIQLQKDSQVSVKLVQLSALFKCQPEQLQPVAEKFVMDFQTLQKDLQTVNNQLAEITRSNSAANQEGVPKENVVGETDNNPVAIESNPSDNTPRIKKMDLAAPQNQWARRDDSKQLSSTKTGIESPAVLNQSPRTDSIQAGAANSTGYPDSKVPAGPVISTAEYVKLMNRIQSLEADLKNREKLLFEQTSLIENLKRKSRIETGLRTRGGRPETNSLKQPFRDRGTFAATDR